MLIVLANRSVASYPMGGGVWSWMLQYPLGLRALGHNIFWLEIMKSSGDPARDAELAKDFFARISPHGLAPHSAVVVCDDLDHQDLDRAQVYGRSKQTVFDIARSADLLWNIACAIRQPLLSKFPRRVLIDVDPGHLQVSAIEFEMGVADHQVHLSVGANLPDPDCEVPTLGFTWRTFLPFVYLPIWQASPDPGPAAPFTSITQWSWEELYYQGRVWSLSKRAAYMRYVDLPKRAGRPFELAALIGDADPTADREALHNGGWRVVDPYQVAATPEAYREYLRASRAEILCPKPIFREMNTGWFSDRSVCYLALGRPVLAEETGFGDFVPTGRGILDFRNIDEAQAAVAEIDGNYHLHSRWARELAEDLFNSDRQLTAMLGAC
jgi:hypothetical protein